MVTQITNYTYLPLQYIPFWKRQTKGNAMVTSIAEFDDLQKWPPMEAAQRTQIYPTIYTFLKTADQGHCNGDLYSWFWWPPEMTSNRGRPNNAYLRLQYIPFWKQQTKHNAMVTSAADFDDLQKWPPMEAAQITHIYAYNIYLFENDRPRAMQWWPLQLILMTSKSDLQ